MKNCKRAQFWLFSWCASQHGMAGKDLVNEQRQSVMIRTGSRCVMTLLIGVLMNACVISQPSPPAGEAEVSPTSVSQAIGDEQLPELGSLTGDRTPSEGALVRWGGSIASVMNQSDGSTLLEIVSRPLYSGGRPIHDDRSEGRFLAVLDGFLDPEIVTAGRDVTVLGKLAGRKPGKIGESDYVFPVVYIQDYRIWKPVVTLPPRHFPYWTHYPPFGHADPFRRDWPFGTRPRLPVSP